jgi:hypothetical protein
LGCNTIIDATIRQQEWHIQGLINVCCAATKAVQLNKKHPPMQLVRIQSGQGWAPELPQRAHLTPCAWQRPKSPCSGPVQPAHPLPARQLPGQRRAPGPRSCAQPLPLHLAAHPWPLQWCSPARPLQARPLAAGAGPLGGRRSNPVPAAGLNTVGSTAGCWRGALGGRSSVPVPVAPCTPGCWHDATLRRSSALVPAVRLAARESTDGRRQTALGGCSFTLTPAVRLAASSLNCQRLCW